ELHWFYQDGASMIFPDAWERFIAPIPEDERHDLMGAYYKRLIGEDVAERERCAVAWSSWEGETVSVEGPSARPDKFAEPDFALAFARIENWYFTNGGFFPEEGWLLKNIGRIRHIPTWIAQGRFDVVTPIASAWALHRAMPEARLDIVADAGHASSEPGIVDSLVRGADWAATL
ncbi:MAG: alpha/beta fold hydrolase, partial [Brevundimonas sp.]